MLIKLTLSTVLSSFCDRFSLCSPVWPRIPYVDQTGPELRDLPASAAQGLGIKGMGHHTLQINSVSFI